MLNLGSNGNLHINMQSNNFMHEDLSEKDELDCWSSFADETLSHGAQSDLGIDNPPDTFELKVLPVESISQLQEAREASQSSPLELFPPLPYKRGESMIEKYESKNPLDVLSGKELALNFLKRNNDMGSSYFRINSMVTNANSVADFKKELISCINVPPKFRKTREREAIQRSQSIPRSNYKENCISDGKCLALLRPFLYILIVTISLWEFVKDNTWYNR